MRYFFTESYFRYFKDSQWRRILVVGLFFTVSIFGDFREVANWAKIKPMRKIPDIPYKFLKLAYFRFYISYLPSTTILAIWDGAGTSNHVRYADRWDISYPLTTSPWRYLTKTSILSARQNYDYTYCALFNIFFQNLGSLELGKAYTYKIKLYVTILKIFFYSIPSKIFWTVLALYIIKHAKYYVTLYFPGSLQAVESL